MPRVGDRKAWKNILRQHENSGNSGRRLTYAF